MNQVKSRLAALALLDRAMNTLPDSRLDELIVGLNEEFRTAFDHVIGWREDETRGLVEVTREACHKGRLNGTLERVAALISDGCLEECIGALGESADNPSEEQLLGAAPALIEHHGLEVVRVMLASAVAGEAAAAAVCSRLLKHDETLALPPVEHVEAKVAPPADDDPEREALKERRRLERQRKQADQRARREQAAKAGGRKK